MSKLFETVKAVVTTREAAERYGLPVSQGGMAICPFHPDKTPSMKLYEDHFYCFGCGAHGDVIDLTGQLLGLAPVNAAKQVASDFGIDTGQQYAPKQNRHEIHRFREDEMFCFSVLMDYLRLLERWKREYAPVSPEDSIDDRFVEACQMLDRIEYMADVLAVGDFAQRAALVDELTGTGMIQRLAEYVGRRKERVVDDGEQKSA